jgi:hypothetical protein
VRSERTANGVKGLACSLGEMPWPALKTDVRTRSPSRTIETMTGLVSWE